MFQITEFTYARLASITARVEKHGDDDKPAVSLKLEIEAPNTLLDVIDPGIRHSLYKAVDDQEQLPGVEPATPVLRCNSFEKHALTTAHEGWTLAVDYGINEEAPMVFGGCKVDKFAVEAKQGGSIVLSFRVGTSDIDADKVGRLHMHNGDDIAVTLKAPEKKPDAIDGSVEAFEADHPGAGEGDATDLFAETSSEGDAAKPDSNVPDDDPFYPDAVALVRAKMRASISLVQRDFQIGYNRAARLLERMEAEGVVSAQDAEGNRTVIGAALNPDAMDAGGSKRTARGRDKTKAALAAGLAQHQASDSTQALTAASDAAQAHIKAVAAKHEAAEGAAS